MSERIYKCEGCGRAGCKLWRDYQTLANQTRLLCRACSEKAQDGKHQLEVWCDQIGWMVPAVPAPLPDAAGNMPVNEFWGYTSVPPEGVAWWKGLPL